MSQAPAPPVSDARRHSKAAWFVPVLAVVAALLVIPRLVRPRDVEAARARPPATLAVEDVRVQPASFAPSLDQSCDVRYTLPAAVRTTVGIYGPNEERVRLLLDGAEQGPGQFQVTWDGRDEEGRPVPDEAYFVRIDLARGDEWGAYDPTEFSGGDRVHPRDLEYSAQDDTITYALPKACRVLVRAGIYGGPVLKTVLNWRPRSAGFCTEVWKGRDEQNVRRFSVEEDAHFVVQCHGLPENSILTYGNREQDYREWYVAHGAELPRKPEVDRSSQLIGIQSQHWLLPTHLDKDPPLALTFLDAAAPPAAADDPVEVSGERTRVRIDVSDDLSREFIANQRFELVVFLDDERITEAEMAQVPFNWSWDLSSVPPGEYWLTVNLVTFQQHVGVVSQRVQVASQAESDEDPSTSVEQDSDR